MRTYPDEEITAHEALENITVIVLVGFLVQERRGVYCRHAICRVSSIHQRSDTVHGD